jgi:uncharacterized RDD family membrane protein YckC
MESVNPPSAGHDLLGDLDQIVVLNYASQGQRFGNYIIDRILAYGFAFMIAFGIGMIYGLRGESADGVFEGLPLYLLMYSAYLSYYTLFEALNKGRTVGKMITGTYAIATDGTPITWKLAFLRSLSRLVPFEAFSGFSAAPWHDRWTETTVVKK